MNDQPDKFFRDKLEGWQPPVSARTRERVVWNVDRRRRKTVWLKVAAGVAALIAAAVLLGPLMVVHNPPIADVALQRRDNTPAEPDTRSKVPADLPATELSPAGERDGGKGPLPTARKSVPDTRPALTGRRTISASEEGEDVPAGVQVNSDSTDTAVPAPRTERKAVTIILTATEVNERYLQKSTSPDATSEEQDPSSLRKVIDRVNALKHNQGPIATLRQKKNEILAFSFNDESPSHENE